VLGQELQTSLDLRGRPNLATLPNLLLRVYTELTVALSGVRVTRETIQMHSVERFRNTHARLSEVSSATETAAMEMLNGLDRTLAMIDQLEGTTDDRRPSHEMCDALRTEVNQLYGCLQFQDIVTQQLHGVTALLVEIEERLESVAQLFDEPTADGQGGAPSAAQAPVDPATFNPEATMRDVVGRQAMIDETFRVARNGTQLL